MAAEKDPLGRGWIIAGALLLLIIGGILAGLLIPRSEDPAPPPGTTPPPTSTPSSPSPTATNPENEPPKTAGACTADLNDDQDFPATAPETTWDRHASGVIIPTSPDYGPGAKHGDLWGCFPQSPKGALFAGLNLYAAYAVGEQEALAEDSLVSAPSPSAGPAYGESDPPVFEGYRILMSDEKEASVQYLARQGGRDVAMTLDLVWDENANDWRLNLGTPTPVVDAVTDRSVFTRWR